MFSNGVTARIPSMRKYVCLPFCRIAGSGTALKSRAFPVVESNVHPNASEGCLVKSRTFFTRFPVRPVMARFWFVGATICTPMVHRSEPLAYWPMHWVESGRESETCLVSDWAAGLEALDGQEPAHEVPDATPSTYVVVHVHEALA